MGERSELIHAVLHHEDYAYTKATSIKWRDWHLTRALAARKAFEALTGEGIAPHWMGQKRGKV